MNLSKIIIRSFHSKDVAIITNIKRMDNSSFYKKSKKDNTVLNETSFLSCYTIDENESMEVNYE